MRDATKEEIERINVRRDRIIKPLSSEQIERRRERQREYYQENRDTILIRHKAYDRSHRDEKNLRERERYEKEFNHDN